MKALTQLLHNPVGRRLVITLLITSLAVFGVAIDPQLADDLVTVASVVAETL